MTSAILPKCLAKDETLCVELRIEGFLPVPESFVKPFYSPLFQFWDSNWYFEVIPRFSEGRIQLRLLRRHFLFDHEVVVACTISIVKADGTRCVRREAIWRFNTGTSEGVPCFLNSSVLLKQKNEFFPSDVFTIDCLLWTSWPPGSLITRSSDLNMAPLDEFCDLTFRFKTSKHTLQAHKVILAANSPVFAEMLEKEMYKSDTMLTMDDFDPKLITAFLCTFYNDILMIKESNAFDMYRIASKYRVTKLKMYCLLFIAQNLSTDNVCDVAAFAEETGNFDMMEYVIHFLEDNMSVFLTPKWESFMKDHCRAANKLLKFLLSRCHLQIMQLNM